MVKGAFTLIELLFAIVIMSIVMLAFPTVMQTDSDAREQNLAQEAALAGSAKLAQVLSYQWDENSTSLENINENGIDTAILVDGTNHVTNAFNRVGTTQNRLNGSVAQRRFFPATVNASPIADNNTSIPAIDDFDGTFSTTGTPNAKGYKRNYRLDVSVYPVSDALRADGGIVDYDQTLLTSNSPIGDNRFILTHDAITGGQTNLRCVEVKVSDNSDAAHTPLAIMYGYAANIGEYNDRGRPRP